MKHKLLILFSIFLIFAAAGISAAAADVMYTYKVDETRLTRGVTLTTYKLFMSDKTWIETQVAAADLTHDNLRLQLLSNRKGINYRTTVGQLAKDYDTTVAVNADFFNYDERAGRGSPINGAFFNGNMLSTPSNLGTMYSLAQYKDNTMFIGMFDYTITLTAPNGNSTEVRSKNKSDDLTGIVMYDKYWDTQSLGSTDTKHEMVVKDGIVTEIRFNSEPITFDDSTYVFAALSDWDTFLIDNFKAGDEVKLDIKSNYNYDDLSLVVGGGSHLVKDGNVQTSFSHNVFGNNPKTAAGISRDGLTAYFVTVNGRLNSSRGMSMSEIANYMKSVGAYNAIDFDGGGSTTMVAKSPDTSAQNVINIPSDGTQRAIETGLGIVSNQPADSEPAIIELTAPEGVWLGSRSVIDVRVLNKFYNPLGYGDIEWSVEGGNGAVINGTYYPAYAGEAVITASYGGIYSKIKINVYDTPYLIEKETDTISLNTGESANVGLYVKNEDGYGAYIPICDTKISLTKDIADIDGWKIKAKAPGSAIMSVTFGDATVHYLLKFGSNENIAIPDDKTGRDSKNQTAGRRSTFAVFGDQRESTTLFNNLIMSKSLGAMNASANNAFFLSTGTASNVASKMSITTYDCKTYWSFTAQDSTYIILDTADNFMSAKEWNWFIDKMNNLTTKNVFVFMQTNLKFITANESRLFKDVLSGAADYGYDIYVFYNDTENKMTSDNGVRYFSNAGFSKNVSLSNFVSLSPEIQYLLVDIGSGGAVSYEYVPVYK